MHCPRQATTIIIIITDRRLLACLLARLYERAGGAVSASMLNDAPAASFLHLHAREPVRRLSPFAQPCRLARERGRAVHGSDDGRFRRALNPDTTDQSESEETDGSSLQSFSHSFPNFVVLLHRARSSLLTIIIAAFNCEASLRPHTRTKWSLALPTRPGPRSVPLLLLVPSSSSSSTLRSRPPRPS